MASQVERAARAARFYARRGWAPIPSRRDKKAPVKSFDALGCGWERPFPTSLLAGWAWPNIQLMTGTFWGLCAVDLDGPEAVDAWADMGRCPDTWTVSRGPGSRHLWFRLPDWLPECRSAAKLWGVPTGHDDHGRVTWKRHTAVELLADRKLVIAPPSIHPETGTEYEFIVSPRDLREPAEVPGWVLTSPDLDVPPERPPVARGASRAAPDDREAVGRRYDARDVLAAIPDPISLAESWGLRVTRQRCGGGLSCHAIGRTDHSPSAAIYPSGYYWDSWIRGGRGISIFDVAAELGVYPDWTAAVRGLGARFAAPSLA